jgi:hypothetical protein
MNELKPWYARVGYYLVTVNTLFQFFTIVVLGWTAPRWTVISNFALLALIAGAEAERQWMLASRYRKLRREYLRVTVHARNLAEEPVRLIKITKPEEDDDEYPS